MIRLILLGIVVVVIAGVGAYIWLGQGERNYARMEAYRRELRSVSSQLRIGQSQEEVRQFIRLRIPSGFTFVEDDAEGGDMLISPRLGWFVYTEVVLLLEYKGGKLRRRFIYERGGAL